jgi:hypothetical protein
MRRKYQSLMPIRIVAFTLLFVAIASPLSAQRGRGAGYDPRDEYSASGYREGRMNAPLREGLPDSRQGFMFCRLFYQSNRTEPSGLGWSTDYPRGDENLSVRLVQLTSINIGEWKDGQPGHAVVRPTDDNLFQCPFLFASDIGTAAFTDEDAQKLSTYFAKGGFLWVDDFWGDTAWNQWVGEIGRVLPGRRIVDIPPSHPLYTVLYQLDKAPQISNIQYWRRSGGDTSERGAETRNATLNGIFDDDGRLMVLMSHNTDIADGWEREGESDEFFATFSPKAYGLAVNVIIWILTH